MLQGSLRNSISVCTGSQSALGAHLCNKPSSQISVAPVCISVYAPKAKVPLEHASTLLAWQCGHECTSCLVVFAWMACQDMHQAQMYMSL